MNPFPKALLAILLLALPASAERKKCVNPDGTREPNCLETTTPGTGFIQPLEGTDHSKHISSEKDAQNQVTPPVASEFGAFGRGNKPWKRPNSGSSEGSGTRVGDEVDPVDDDVELPAGDGLETQAGDPPDLLLQKLEQDKQRAIAGCAEHQWNADRCRRRAADYFDKVAANIKKDPAGNSTLKLAHLDIGWRLWQADAAADRFKKMAERDPAYRERYERALQQRDDLMHQLHTGAGATAFHAVVMEEVNKEPQPGAGDSYRDWVGRNRSHPPAWVGLGQQQMREGNPQQAVESLSQAIALDPKSAQAYSARAAAHFKMGHIAQAYEDAVAALRLDPNDKSAFATLKLTEGRVGAADGVAGAAQGAGGTNEAGQSSGGGPSFGAYDPAASAANLSNTTPEAIEANRLNALARRAMQLGDKRAALDAAQKSLSAYGQNPFAYGVMARYAFSDREYRAALAAAEAGLKLSPKDRALLSMKARSANRLRDAVAAAAAAEALLGMDARDPEGLANLAHARGLAGDRAGMDSLLAQAARANDRYQVSVESALQMPEGSDMLFLFPGEESTEMLAALKAAKDAKGAPQRFGVVAIASLIGGLLIGLGLLSSMAGPLTQRVKSAFTRMTGSHPVMRQEDRAMIAPALEIPGVAEAGLLRGQYRVKKQIGAGGMGLVFEGEDITLGRRVAIKKMRDELRLDRRERQRFVNEAKVVAALHHANIVDIYAIVEDNEDVYLVFEYVKGSTVHDLIGVKGALSWREALGIFRSMTAALEFAHGRNIIHRDLKPSNVMVDDEGYVKVMDFGIARVAKDAANKVSMTNTVVGTPPYMAPEQEQGVVRKESDVYALAICLYEMLTGKMPFVGVAGGMLMNKLNMNFVKPSAMVGGLPAGIDEVFVKAFQADPDKRFASAREMLSALNDLAPATRPDSAPTSLRNLPD